MDCIIACQTICNECPAQENAPPQYPLLSLSKALVARSSHLPQLLNNAPVSLCHRPAPARRFARGLYGVDFRVVLVLFGGQIARRLDHGDLFGGQRRPPLIGIMNILTHSSAFNAASSPLCFIGRTCQAGISFQKPSPLGQCHQHKREGGPIPRFAGTSPRAYRPHLAKNSPLDCFPGARCHCGGEAKIADCGFKASPPQWGGGPRSGSKGHSQLKLTTLPSGEGGLPRPKGLASRRSGKTDEVLGGWLRAFIATEARSIMSGDLISHGKAVTASPKGKPFEHVTLPPG